MRRRWQYWIPALFLTAGAVWMSPVLAQPDGVPFWRGGQYSDILISHLPNAIWLREALARWHQVPLWNPLILSGAPFAADPLSGMWYPPNWLAMVLPATLAFNLLFWIHLAWGGYGLYRLLRAEGVGAAGALLGGLLFSGTPKWVGHIGLGHLGLVSAVGWTPWCLLAVRGMVGEAVGGRGWRAAALAGGLSGLVFLADPRWVIPCGGLTVAYGGRVLSHSHTTRRYHVGGLAAAGAVVVAFAGGISAVLALPLAEFVPLTTRAALTAAERASLSLPSARLLGLLYPDLGGWPEWMAYISTVAMMLAALAVLLRAPGRLFWSLTALAGWLLALGAATPLYPIIGAVLPTIRVPPRFLLLSAIAVCSLAGWGLQRLLDSLGGRTLLPRARLVLSGFAAGIVVLAAGFAVVTGEVPPGLVGTAILAVTAATWGIWSMLRALPPGTMAAGWILLAVLDTAWVDRSLLAVRPLSESLNERAAVIEALRTGFGGRRVFSPSYSLPQQSTLLARVELADGVNPLQLAAYVEFMAQTVGFSNEGYSVTLPPFPDGDPRPDWSPQIDVDRLGLLDVGYVVSEYALQSPGLVLEGQIDGVYVYSNPSARPRAWVQGSGGEWWPVESLEWSPNRIGMQATGPGRLVLSEVAYPGWQARVDGELIDVDVCSGVLRCLLLPEGTHRVVFEFRPRTVYAGLALTALSVALMALLWRRR